MARQTEEVAEQITQQEQQTSLSVQAVERRGVRDFFTLYQDCINLRIKTHTTKNIINNKLLLWQRGVHGFSPLVHIHSYKRSAVFQTAVQPITDSLVKCNRLYIHRRCSQFIQENTPILYHLVLGSQR